MLRSMMQVYVQGSVEAVYTYPEAFNAEILGVYPDVNGGYMHSELNACGEILAHVCFRWLISLGYFGVCLYS